MAAGGSDNAAPSTHQPLEQFVLLAKSAKGAAVVALITQALEAPGVYVFGELLDMPNVQEVGRSKRKSLPAAWAAMTTVWAAWAV